MKLRLVIVIALALPAVTFSQAKTGDASGRVKAWLVPAVVENKLRVEHPGAEPTWKKEGALYHAEFINPLNNLGYVLVYDSTGRVIRRDKELENADYPAQINDYMRSKYEGEGYTVWSTTDSAGHVNFYSPRADKIVRFDKTGKPVSSINVRTAVSDSVLQPVVK